MSRRTRMAISRSLLHAVMLFHLLILPKSITLIARSDNDHRQLIDEVRQAELKVVRLESILEEHISILDSKNLYIKETEKRVKELTSEFDHVHSFLLTVKNDSSFADERLYQLEEEVQLLWGTARRNNFELHTLESKAQDAEKRLNGSKSRFETMAAIVNEQWIQIQHLEQALVNAHFVEMQFQNFLDDWWEMLEATWSALKQNHHQLQWFVKNEMQKWKYTAAFANEEVVFFVASALITFPAFSLGVFLLNNFC